MLENASLHVSAKPATPAAQVERARRLRRSFVRQFLRRKPTRLESAVIDRAALMTALAEAAALDPMVHPDTVVRLDGAAARARAALSKLSLPKSAVPPLRELLNR